IPFSLRSPLNLSAKVMVVFPPEEVQPPLYLTAVAAPRSRGEKGGLTALDVLQQSLYNEGTAHKPLKGVTTMTTTTKNKPTPTARKKPARFVKLISYPDGSHALVIRQVLSKNREQVDAYALAEIGADTGRGFRLMKPDGTVYSVNVGGDHDSCECLGHEKHGHRTVCKHRASIAALIAQGKL